MNRREFLKSGLAGLILVATPNLAYPEQEIQPSSVFTTESNQIIPETILSGNLQSNYNSVGFVYKDDVISSTPQYQEAQKQQKGSARYYLLMEEASSHAAKKIVEYVRDTKLELLLERAPYDQQKIFPFSTAPPNVLPPENYGGDHLAYVMDALDITYYLTR
jgi:hypothetical protein